MNPLPEIFGRPITFLGRKSGHEWSAARIRLKLSSGSDNFAAEVNQLVLAELGAEDRIFMDEGEAWAEQQIRTQFRDDRRWMLESTEAYLWGLGIAGIYHQFERDIREVIDDLLLPKPSKLQNAKFNELCDYLGRLGYQIKQSTKFDDLCIARLISNAIKHGDGNSFDELLCKRPDLFSGRHASGTDYAT